VLYIFVADVCGGYEIIHMSFTSRLLVMLCFNVSMFIMGFILYFSKPHVLFSNNALYFTCKCRFFCTYDRSPRSIFDDFAGESSRLRTGTLLSTRTSGTTESTTPTLLIFRNSFPRRVELRP
jgi:hypothetical protein